MIVGEHDIGDWYDYSYSNDEVRGSYRLCNNNCCYFNCKFININYEPSIDKYSLSFPNYKTYIYIFLI